MSYGGVFAGLLEQYGQTVEVCRGEEAVGIACRAFVQPVLEKREQMVPTPLGQVRQDRWLYLGDPAVPLELAEDGYIRWQGREYEVLSAQPVYLGGAVQHWWGLLRQREVELV